MDFDNLTPVDKARLAQSILENVVFQRVVQKEIEASTELAISGATVEERDVNRHNVMWCRNLVKTLRDLVKHG